MKNMQNKLYTTQFFSPPNNQLCSQSLSSDHGTCGFCEAHEFRGFSQTHEFCKTQTHWKRLYSWKSLNSQKKRWY